MAFIRWVTGTDAYIVANYRAKTRLFNASGNIARMIPVILRRIGLFLAPGRTHGAKCMLFYGFYIVAVVILVLHFTGWLRRNNLEWLVLVLAVATFPAVYFL